MAARRRHLPNAPITEALIDFRVPPVEVSRDLRMVLEDRLSARYPNITEQTMFEARINVAERESAVARSEGRLHGFMLKAADGVRLAQFRSDGFTFNHLRPYTRWEEVQSEALGLWQTYVEVLRPTLVIRIALRYINHLSFPEPRADLRRYLEAPPSVPSSLSYRLAGFVQRLTFVDTETGARAHVTQALEPAMAETTVVILDIDAYKAAEFEVHDDRLSPALEELREMKNNIFFGSVTEDAARLWE
jgi:uncharacterized protein (TIGR04255 family)